MNYIDIYNCEKEIDFLEEEREYLSSLTKEDLTDLPSGIVRDLSRAFQDISINISGNRKCLDSLKARL